MGEQTWEFVSGDPIEGTLDGVEAVPVNQMYNTCTTSRGGSSWGR